LKDRKTGQILSGVKENAPPVEEGMEDEEDNDGDSYEGSDEPERKTLGRGADVERAEAGRPSEYVG
jgi:hypothetical protein